MLPWMIAKKGAQQKKHNTKQVPSGKNKYGNGKSIIYR
jgi:hypothetical protein